MQKGFCDLSWIPKPNIEHLIQLVSVATVSVSVSAFALVFL